MCKALLLSLLLLAACNSEIYTRDGVTDGDSFYLAPRAFQDDDPVLQSWVAYSLMKSTCQLQEGGPVPARVSNYGCELTARQHLLDTWEEQRLEHSGATNPYLDELLAVRQAGFLDEYTVSYFGRRHWQVPAEVRARRVSPVAACAPASAQAGDAPHRLLGLSPAAISARLFTADGAAVPSIDAWLATAGSCAGSRPAQRGCVTSVCPSDSARHGSVRAPLRARPARVPHRSRRTRP